MFDLERALKEGCRHEWETMEPEEILQGPAMEIKDTVVLKQRCVRCGTIKEPVFDLDRCMEQDGGRCLAGDRPARIICTDRKGASGFVVLVDCGDTEEAHTYFTTGNKCAFTANPKIDLRNLPAEKTVEVTLWHNQNRLEGSRWGVSIPASGFEGLEEPGWEAWRTQKVTFPKGE